MPEFHLTCEELRSRALDAERLAASNGAVDLAEARRLDEERELLAEDSDEFRENHDRAAELRERAGKANEDALLEVEALREQAANREGCI